MNLASGARANRRDGVQKEPLHARHLRFARVTVARPEEASEAVPAPAGNHVDVEMGHALADSVVDRDERAFGAEPRFHRARQELDVGEEGTEESGRQIDEERNVAPRDEERGAMEARASIA